MITIQLNGEAFKIEHDISISVLLNQLGLAEKRVAIEYNLEILNKQQHSDTLLKQGDRVEIVHAIGGG